MTLPVTDAFMDSTVVNIATFEGSVIIFYCIVATPDSTSVALCIHTS